MRSVLVSTTGQYNDTKWTIWFRILCAIQSDDSADPAYDPKYNDSVWDLKYKAVQARNFLNS